jgi:hypothetical protein
MTRAAHADEGRRLTTPLLLLVVLCAFSFGAIVRIAIADVSFHTTCVGHGFVHGDELSDGSFFARVDPGCSSTFRTCDLYTYGFFDGGQAVSGTNSYCNAWSRNFGEVSECASTAHVYDAGVFASHIHKASNWCG